MPSINLPGMEWAWLIPGLSLLAFAIIVFLGKRLPGKGSYVAITAIGLGFILFWFVLKDLLYSRPATFNVTWFDVSKYSLKWGMIIDPLSVLMLGVVTSVAFAIQVYSLGYMKGDPRFGWYFAVQALFAASMLGLVLADNFLLLYITWELVGICSYLLIGFWYERRSAAEAAKKAFVTTRLGDVGLLIGILILFKQLGTFDMSTIFQAAQRGDISAGILTLVAILIFLGAMGKSAQFPLHVWLPDAMEGPTPVSALIHAATMVAAGVYLVARSFPLFEVAPYALDVVAIIGLLTTLIGSTLALVMTDLKRIIAYSTISKLGFMMLALGSGGYAAAMLYLMTHAFFKALLFLGAGSVIHSTGKQDIREMGGLWRKMPVTAVTFIVAAIALAGLPPLSGFFSKDEALIAIRDAQSPVVYLLALVAVFLSALYVARPAFVVFFGRLKPENAHAHESPPVMTVPMMALAFMSIISGFFVFNWVGPLFGLPAQFKGFGAFLFLEHPEAFHFDVMLAVYSTLIAIAALGLGWTIYHKGLISPASIMERFAGVHRVLVNKFYMDDFYQAIINRVVLAFSNLVALFDRRVVNDTGVNGTANLTAFAGYRLRYHETGKFYDYALAIALGTTLIVIVAFLVT
ncbi:MAG: NADH-quinone oxidoreductase subunit L [Chloroflexi bacterium]|nr:NADH-quinone oxidoreductase subunit L [Chloroflexota bacterium]